MPFKQRLKGKIGSRVIVVMTDGTGFRGIVQAVEEGLIIMSNVEETTLREISWEETEGGECGFHHWCKVNLPKVYLNPMHISRVWALPVEEHDRAEKKDKNYLYIREPMQIM